MSEAFKASPSKRRIRLPAAIEKVLAGKFEQRMLPFDEESARVFSKIHAMIASITLSRHAALATRNTNDFDHCGIRIINPWKGVPT